ncbi:peptide-methionine (R)-S-oxide reductase MsrB [Candidatus Uhrbacteria bacterium]|nr:peptide-methionine (R)-S-oxide reductase MsrB [Candidatus Uhrbacteria bacterium]
MQLSEEMWREKLTPEQYRVLRHKGTEAPFTGEFYLHHEDGMYHCAGCDAPLFASGSKFDSGCGWPSFDEVADSEVIQLIEDTSLGMHRTEVVCASCGGHLGHLFQDGPTQTGNRFCINSTALNFSKKHV